MRGLYFIMLAFASLSSMYVFAQTAPTLDIDFNPGESIAEKVMGWNDHNERTDADTFCWMRGLEADLKVDLPVGSTYSIDIYAQAFYYGNCRQTFALFVNNRYVDEWLCEHDDRWKFTKYSAVIPADYLKGGKDRLTFRTSYQSQHKPLGYSLAVDKILLEPRDAQSDSSINYIPVIIPLVFCAVLLYIFTVVTVAKKG